MVYLTKINTLKVDMKYPPPPLQIQSAKAVVN